LYSYDLATIAAATTTTVQRGRISKGQKTKVDKMKVGI
jgi:hypothetical protein